MQPAPPAQGLLRAWRPGAVRDAVATARIAPVRGPEATRRSSAIFWRPGLVGLPPGEHRAAAEHEDGAEQDGRHGARDPGDERAQPDGGPADDGRDHEEAGQERATARGGGATGDGGRPGGTCLRGAASRVGGHPVLGAVRSVHGGASCRAPGGHREPLARGQQPRGTARRRPALRGRGLQTDAPVAHRDHAQRLGEPVVRPGLEQLLPVPQLVRHQVCHPQADQRERDRSCEIVHVTTVGVRTAPARDQRGVSACASPVPGPPAGEQPARHVLDGERERAVVAPAVLDVQVPLAQPLVAEAQLLDDPQRRPVLRPDVDLDAVQPERVEAVVGGQRDGRRGDPAARRRARTPSTRSPRTAATRR